MRWKHLSYLGEPPHHHITIMLTTVQMLRWRNTEQKRFRRPVAELVQWFLRTIHEMILTMMTNLLKDPSVIYLVFIVPFLARFCYEKLYGYGLGHWSNQTQAKCVLAFFADYTFLNHQSPRANCPVQAFDIAGVEKDNTSHPCHEAWSKRALHMESFAHENRLEEASHWIQYKSEVDCDSGRDRRQHCCRRPAASPEGP